MTAADAASPSSISSLTRARPVDPSDETNAFAEQALTQAKQEGLLLAVRARWIALAIVAVLIPIVNFSWEVIYHHAILIVFALIGWAQLKVGEVGQSRRELFLIYCDLILLTIAAVVPNPLATEDWPVAVQYRFGTFIFFFIFLAGATLAYSWRTVVAFGTWTTFVWGAGLLWAYFYPNAQPDLTVGLKNAWPDEPVLAAILDPNAFMYGWRLQEVVVFLIVAAILAIGVRRSSDLLKSHAAFERERTNLARYFSPNVVDELSKHDEPLKTVRTQNVAVLFVDIVGFTRYAADKDPQEVVDKLREFLSRMEREVFRHGGTLDKYLGDGLMATFGTPFASDRDASNALRAAKAMLVATDALNKERARAGEEPIKASVGVHYGPVLLGNIGTDRLEFAVIGNTVNVASRLEELSRTLGCQLVVSGDLVEKAESEQGHRLRDDLAVCEPQKIRGLPAPLPVWTG